MNDTLLTMLSMEGPSILLSMDGTEGDHFRQMAATSRPPDINLPLSVDICSPSTWPSSSSSKSSKTNDILDVSLATTPPTITTNMTITTTTTSTQMRATLTSSKGKRINRRSDSIWGAWFFFNHYFRPSHNDSMGHLKLDQFMVQHDMENMYMWVFRDRPENALGKMQLRSYMNGHARFGEPQFPFSVEKGFTRSHRMQRKQYRGLSNPQCIHGVEVCRNPNFSLVCEEDKKRWEELSGRDLGFTLAMEAGDFSEWRTLPYTDLDFERSDVCSLGKCSNGSKKQQHSPKSIEGEYGGGSTLDLSCKLIGQLGSSSSFPKRKRKLDSSTAQCGNADEECCAPPLGEIVGEEIQQNDEQPLWLSESSGVLLEASGPVTGAKTIYEDEKGYLIMVSLPFTDMTRLRVSWLNTTTHGVVKIHGISTARVPIITRGDRTFKLTDSNPEHCLQGEYIREIPLATRIPENAELKAFYVEASAGLEIMVPKHSLFSEEREVRVFLPPQLGNSEVLLL